MRRSMGKGNEPRDEMHSILNLWLARAQQSTPETENGPVGQHERTGAPREGSGTKLPHGEPNARYDFDLAEFPLFTLHKNSISGASHEPLVYTDTVTGQDGKPVTRTWKTSMVIPEVSDLPMF